MTDAILVKPDGTFTVGRKAEWPTWTPTPDMIERDPASYAQYEDGMPGGPDNPLGARALYLYNDAGYDTALRIHGTPQPWTVASAISPRTRRTHWPPFRSIAG